jgi:Ca-activated chloride channel family protein
LDQQRPAKQAFLSGRQVQIYDPADHKQHTCPFIPSCCAFAQTTPGGQPLNQNSRTVVELGWSTLSFMHGDLPERQGISQKPLDSVSKLDLMAPGKARGEYEKGLQLLYRKDFNRAVAHLEKAVSIFPKYVSAHDALGTAYMDLGQNEKALTEFQIAVSLDDHLPYSYANLGRANLALGDYPAAVQALQQASSISPLDLTPRLLLAYGQFMSHDYPAVIATAQQVHQRKHDQAAIVHYMAAAAWQEQHNLPEMQSELQLFLDEDPNSQYADQVRKTNAQIDEEQNHPRTSQVTVAFAANSDPVAASPGLPASVRNALRKLELQRQVDLAECETCLTTESREPALEKTKAASVPTGNRDGKNSYWTLHKTVDEIGVFFAATDAGRAVNDLRASEVQIRDDGKAPAAVLGFRNESELPLRLGLIIDSSASITDRFAFERNAAAGFLKSVATQKDDLVFAVGFANSVLLVQDFTSDENKVAAGLDKLAPAGGTALWDAVTFGTDKLARRPEERPGARILVVISDGEDNSSAMNLKEAIENAQREEVVVYAVSTREGGEDASSNLGDRALKALALQTGGAFFPGSLGHLNRSLNELQQVIRSRYLVSYKPAEFTLDGRYHSIEIAAQKSGHKLRVYARKGYYAHPAASSAD